MSSCWLGYIQNVKTTWTLCWTWVTVGVQGNSVHTIKLIVHKPTTPENGKNKYDIEYTFVSFSLRGEGQLFEWGPAQYTDKKENQIFLIYKEIQN
jgi:hypothetical protein